MKRKEDESFESYKERRKKGKIAEKKRLRTVKVFWPSTGFERNMGTYRKKGGNKN